MPQITRCYHGARASSCNAEDPGSISGQRSSLGEGIGYPLQYSWASLMTQMVKNPPNNVEDLSLTLGLGRSPGGGHGNPLQYSCLENPHGLRNLASYNPWGCKELHTTQPRSTYNTALWQSVFLEFANVYYIFT